MSVPTLTVHLGWSALKKSRDAAREALSRVPAGEAYRLVLVYGSARHDHAEILAEVRRNAPDAPVLGCSTTGEMCPEGVLRDGLVVAGLASDHLEAGVGHGAGVFSEPRAAARRAVDQAREALAAAGGPERAHRVCILHTAGFTLSQPGVEEDVLAAIKEQLGDGWIIAGGSAGDGARFLRSFQLAGDQVLQGSVVVGLIHTDLRVTSGLGHGFVPQDRSFAVTEVDGTLVRRIEGRPALDFYADLLGVKPKKLTAGLGLIRASEKVPRFLMSVGQGAGLTPKMITEKIPFFRHAMEHPFGVESPGGLLTVKVPKAITREGFLEFQTRLDGVERLRLMRLDPERTMTASARAVEALRDDQGVDPVLALIFECNGRYMFLLDRIDQLFERLRDATTAKIVGFFSNAEQGALPGLGCQAHNYSVSALGLG